MSSHVNIPRPSADAPLGLTLVISGSMSPSKAFINDPLVVQSVLGIQQAEFLIAATRLSLNFFSPIRVKQFEVSRRISGVCSLQHFRAIVSTAIDSITWVQACRERAQPPRSRPRRCPDPVEPEGRDHRVHPHHSWIRRTPRVLPETPSATSLQPSRYA